MHLREMQSKTMSMINIITKLMCAGYESLNDNLQHSEKENRHWVNLPANLSHHLH